MKNTLKQNFEFRRLYHRGKSAANKHVAVYVRRSRFRVNRLGLTVSPKLGGAVTRNRVKRILREAWRALQPGLPTGFDVVIVARSPCVKAKTPEVTASLRKALRSAGLPQDGGVPL